MLKLIDLLIFFIANIGLAYVVTQSVLLKEPRQKLSDWFYSNSLSNKVGKKKTLLQIIYSKLDYLITCIICASVWTCLPLYFLSKKTTILQVGSNFYDLIFLICCAPAATLLFNTFMLEEEEE